MTDVQRTVTKVLATQQDLLFGEGQVQQTRSGGVYLVDKIRGFYPCNSQEELDALDPEKFPKAVLVTETQMEFFRYDGNTYVSLGINATDNNALITYKASVSESAIDVMVASARVGTVCSTGFTSWVRTADSTNSIKDFVPLTAIGSKDFGAKADGITNDTNALVAALAYIGDSGLELVLQGSDQPYLLSPTPESGDFMLYLGNAAGRTANNNIKIRAEGNAVLKLGDNVGPAVLIFGAGVGDTLENVTFEDIVFDLNGQNNLQESYTDPLRYNSAAYLFCKCTNVKFKNCYILNGSGHQLIRVGGDSVATFGEDIEFDVTIDTFGRAIPGNLVQDVSAVYCQASNIRGSIRGINPEHSFDLSKGQTLAELHADSIEGMDFYAEQIQLPLLLVGAFKPVDLVTIASLTCKNTSYLLSLDPSGTQPFLDIVVDNVNFTSTKVAANPIVIGAAGEAQKERARIIFNAPNMNAFGSTIEDTHIFKFENTWFREIIVNNPKFSGFNGCMLYVAGEIKANDRAVFICKNPVCDSLGSEAGVFPNDASVVHVASSTGRINVLEVTGLTVLNTTNKDYSTLTPIYLNALIRNVIVDDEYNGTANDFGVGYNGPLLKKGPSYSALRESYNVNSDKYSSQFFDVGASSFRDVVTINDVSSSGFSSHMIRVIGAGFSGTFSAEYNSTGSTITELSKSGAIASDISVSWTGGSIRINNANASPQSLRVFIDGVSTNGFLRLV